MPVRPLRACACLLLLSLCSLAPAAAPFPPTPSGAPIVDPFTGAYSSCVLVLAADEAGNWTSSSGFIVHPDGIVATAWPELAGARKARLIFASGASYPVQGVLSWDTKRRDFALLKVEATGLPASPLGNSDAVRETDRLVALGLSPRLAHSSNPVEAGPVQELSDGVRWRQIRAPLPSECSGGPIVNTKGDAVGLALVLLDSDDGLAFAIPVNDLKSLLDPTAEVTPLSEAIYPDIPRRAQQDFYRSLCLDELGRHEGARAALAQAVSLAPDFPDAHTALAWTYDRLGKPYRALAAARLALRAKADLTDPHYTLLLLGSVCDGLGRPQEALRAYQDALLSAPDCPEAHYGLATAHAHLTNWRRAALSYERAIALKPDYPEAHCGRARAYLDLDDPEQSLSSYEEAIRLDAASARAHCGLAYAYRDLARDEEAVQTWRHAIALDPTFAGPHYALGNFHGRQRRWREAVTSFEIALQLDPALTDAEVGLCWARTNLRGGSPLGWLWYQRLDRDHWTPALGPLTGPPYNLLLDAALLVGPLLLILGALRHLPGGRPQRARAIRWALAAYPILALLRLAHLYPLHSLPERALYLAGMIAGILWVFYGAWRAIPGLAHAKRSPHSPGAGEPTEHPLPGRSPSSPC